MKILPSKKKIRVAYVMQNVGNDLATDLGPSILIKQTVRGLHNVGFQVTVFRLKRRSVIAIRDISNLEDTVKIQLGISGSLVFKIGESSVRRLQRELRLPYFALFDSFRFFEACRHFLPGYSSCHEYAGLFSLGTALACRKLEIPYVLTFDGDSFLENRLRGTPLTGLRAALATWQAKITYRLARKIIAVSAIAKNQLVDTWNVDPQKIVVIPNGVDINHFNPGQDPQDTRKKWSLGDGAIICFLGWFELWHGIDNLVECFAKVIQEFPSAKLLLIGDGPARPVVEQQIADLDLESNAIITGIVSHAHVPTILAVADIAVLPYPQLPGESWFSPLKLFEYMAAGKAIVASNEGQITEVIQHEFNGLLVDPGHINELARAIIRLIKNPKLRKQLGRNARLQAVQRHTWGRTVRHHQELYLNLL